MARRKAEVAARRQGLRDRLVSATEAALERLQGADSVVCDFSAERARLRARLAALRAGDDVLFRRWGDGAVGEFWPDRSARLCRLVGDELRPAVAAQMAERAAAVQRHAQGGGDLQRAPF